LEGRVTAGSSLFEAKVLRRDRMLHSKYSGCANLQCTHAHRKLSSHKTLVKRDMCM